MKYPESYLSSHDIDWFCAVNDFYIHVASAGGDIPSQINDVESLKEAQFQVALLPDIYTDEEIEYNEAAIKNVLGPDGLKGREAYIESFTAMSRKGFISYDKTNVGDPTDNRYHRVCKPKDFKRKPQGIKEYIVNINTSFKECPKDVTSAFLEDLLKGNK